MPVCLRCVQVLHELHPVCKGNSNQDVLILHIWLMDIVGRKRSHKYLTVWGLELGMEKAACADCHVLITMLLSQQLI